MNSTDVVVVGGGAAGCWFASRLARAGANVVLLEAGPVLGDDPATWPAPLRSRLIPPRLLDWGFNARIGDVTVPYRCGRVLGGSTVVNACGLSHPHELDAKALERAGGTAWSADGLLRRAGVVLRDLPHEISLPDELARGLADAIVASTGLPRVDDIHGPDVTSGVGSRVRWTTRGGVRWHAARGLGEGAGPGKLTVLADALVTGVAASRESAEVAFWRHGRRERISAPACAIAAGAIGTPLLLRSADLLASSSDARAVVSTLREQIGFGMTFLLHEHAPPASITPSPPVWIRWCSGVSQDVYDVEIVLTPTRLGDRQLLSARLFVVAPAARGVIRSEAGGAIDIALTIDDATCGTLRAAVSWLRATLAQSALVERELHPGGECEGAALDARLRAEPILYYHPVGTCPLGTADEAPVTPSGVLRASPRLRVVDAAVLSEPPRGMPLLTVVAVADAMADAFLDGR